MRTTVNATFGVLLYSDLFRGIQLPGTPGGPKRQITIVHNSILHDGAKITVRLARHGSYEVSAPASILEAWCLAEPKLKDPLPLPRDRSRLFVRSILDDTGCRDLVDKVLHMSQEERADFVESSQFDRELDPKEQATLERLVHHCVATAYTFEAIEKARRASARKAKR